ncbi:MAG: glutamate-5-semialdehyde dehydrogenase [bacterium]|nr:glutamate-5-semialdehyde dehydrogenase [bacterium]
MDMQQMGKAAKTAAIALAKATTEQKNRALEAVAAALEAHTPALEQANERDLAAALERGTAPALVDRLSLRNRLPGIIADVRRVIALPDPVGVQFDAKSLPNGLQVHRRRTPIGVIGVIYENRPNVTVDVAALTLKSGNAAILRGGSETLYSNTALVTVIREALAAEGTLPPDVIQYISDTDRQYVSEMLKLHAYIDMIIPRGGAALHQFCRENSTIPVITGGVGICHVFIDESADIEIALPVIYNAKTSRPSVCNSLDTVLVHQAIAAEFLPQIVELLAQSGVQFRAEPRAKAIVDGAGLNGTAESVSLAGADDFDTEWMALILGLKVVDSLDEAVAHIQRHSLNHSDGIITRNMENAARFIQEVDSSAVFVNASTRFNDGGALGLGAEVAVSTQKLHARGPMALEELTTYKWVVVGDGHIRQ